MSEEKKINKESIIKKELSESDKHIFTNIEVPEGRTLPVKKAGSLTDDRK